MCLFVQGSGEQRERALIKYTFISWDHRVGRGEDEPLGVALVNGP